MPNETWSCASAARATNAIKQATIKDSFIERTDTLLLAGESAARSPVMDLSASYSVQSRTNFVRSPSEMCDPRTNPCASGWMAPCSSVQCPQLDLGPRKAEYSAVAQ